MKKSSKVMFFALLICAGVALYAYRNEAYAELNSLKLIPQSQRFTELYFEKSSLLPNQTVKDKPISFLFTIHNIQGETTVYPYEVYFEDENGTRAVFATGTVTLRDGEFRSIPASYTFLASGLKGKIFVNLTSLNQQIDFLIGNNN